jgi:hypothetical protein
MGVTLFIAQRTKLCVALAKFGATTNVRGKQDGLIFQVNIAREQNLVIT